MTDGRLPQPVRLPEGIVYLGDGAGLHLSGQILSAHASVLKLSCQWGRGVPAASEFASRELKDHILMELTLTSTDPLCFRVTLFVLLALLALGRVAR